MTEERIGKCLRQVEHIRGHLWHIYSIAVNQVMVATVECRSDDFNLTKKNPICVTNDHGYVPLVVNTSRSFPQSWLIPGFVTRLTQRVSLVEQELPTLPEHLSSTLVFSGVRVTRSLVLYVCFIDRCLSFCLFSFGLVLSVLLRYTDSDYPFGIFKLFLMLFSVC
jgi:hypothetical protein